MYSMPENPIIASCERTGYTPSSVALKKMTHVCHECEDANPGEKLFEWNGEYYCADCLREIVLDMLRVSPKEFADMIGSHVVVADYCD